LEKLCLSLKGSIYDEPIAMEIRIQMSSIKKLAHPNADFGLGPPAQAPPHRGFCPGGRALWLGEIAELKTKNSMERSVL
jgi:hypothetical protein